MYIGITTDDKLIFKDNKNRFFVAGCYGKAAFNNMDVPFSLTERYEIESIGTIKDSRIVQGQPLSEEKFKNLKFKIGGILWVTQ